MKLLDIIKNRYSCRAYTAQEVTKEQLENIMESVRMAPSAVNKQPWRFRVISGEAGKAKVRQCYDRQWFSSAGT